MRRVGWSSKNLGIHVFIEREAERDALESACEAIRDPISTWSHRASHDDHGQKTETFLIKGGSNGVRAIIDVRREPGESLPDALEKAE
jgi:hypothetical protein